MHVGLQMRMCMRMRVGMRMLRVCMHRMRVGLRRMRVGLRMRACMRVSVCKRQMRMILWMCVGMHVWVGVGVLRVCVLCWACGSRSTPEHAPA